jgi:hypothetical protein
MAVVQAPRTGAVLLIRWLGLLFGLAVVRLLVDTDQADRRLLIAGPLVGIALLAGVAGGELLAPGPDRGRARRALLETRTVTDYLPPSAQLVGWLLAAYAAVVIGAGLVGGDPATSIASRCFVPHPYAGVWVGPDLTAPGVGAVAVGLGIAAAVLRRLVTRPRPAGVDVAEDDRARRETARALVAGCGILVAMPLGTTAAVAALTLRSSCLSGVSGLGWVLLAVAAVAAAVAVWALGTLLLPRPR